MNLDTLFGSLADPTRRDILQRLTRSELSVSEIANPYDMSLAAVSKHLKILEGTGLVIKERRGKQRIVRLAAGGLAEARGYLADQTTMIELD